jgi:glycyl-tRNA synthetase
MAEQDLLDKVISLAKRRGFIYPSSEIYGGFAAVYDFGPYGVELENALKRFWWLHMVQAREDIVGLDSAIFMHPKIWEASGHVGGFSDPLIECKKCHTRSRADKMLNEIGIEADEKISIEEINRLLDEHNDKIKCPQCGESDFTPAKKFNLLVQSNLGNFTDDMSVDPVYLRGETCQGIYVNFKSVLDSSRVKIPFGIAQIGKAFRNEITARRFIFRTREFEQMEMQFFTSPEDEMIQYEKLRDERWAFYKALGFEISNLRWKKHENLVFYAKEAYDIEYKFPWGFDELEGVHARGNYDLTQHSKFSGSDLSYVDPVTSQKFMPHIIESSSGVGRLVLAILCDAYSEDEKNNEKRVFLKFNKTLAPVQVAVVPLARNKPELTQKARQIFDSLKWNFRTEYDNSGNIGKAYRRQDEIGTPSCVTVDFQTLEDDTVTVRDRDTTKQERVNIDKLTKFLNT